MGAQVTPTGYIHLLCGTYSTTVSFRKGDLDAIEARDPRSLVCCPECQVSTESRSFLPTYKSDAAPAQPPQVVGAEAKRQGVR